MAEQFEKAVETLANMSPEEKAELERGEQELQASASKKFKENLKGTFGDILTEEEIEVLADAAEGE